MASKRNRARSNYVRNIRTFHKLNNENKAKILSRITCSYLYDKIKNEEQKVDELWKINENWIKTVKEA
jgi:hypothetical protein